MSTLSVLLLANMPPPAYEVRIPSEQALWYQFAAPLFLALAVVFFGWWVVRAHDFRRGFDRAKLLAGAGCLAIGFSARWIWVNRDSVISQRGVVDILAVEMPWLWIQFCMLAFLICRSYLHAVRQFEAEAGQRPPPKSHWRNDALAFLLALGTVVPLVLAGDHSLFLPFMFVCWVFAFIAWGILGLVSCYFARPLSGSTSQGQAKPAVPNPSPAPPRAVEGAPHRP